MIDGQNILRLEIPVNPSRTDKDCTVSLQIFVMLRLFMLIWNDFFLDAATDQRERETFLVEPVSSLKLVCNLKHISCKQLHQIVKGNSTLLGNLRNLQNINEVNKLSK